MDGALQPAEELFGSLASRLRDLVEQTRKAKVAECERAAHTLYTDVCRKMSSIERSCLTGATSTR